jgi:FkbM family methyltransferase
MRLLKFAQVFGFFINRIIELFGLHKIWFFEKLWIRLYFRYKLKFEIRIIDWIENNDKFFKTVIDVGAGFGFYSWVIAKNSPNSHIYAFEPEYRNFQRLKYTISLLPNIHRIKIYQNAITKESSTLYIKRDLFNPANHQTLFEENGNLVIHGISLDEFCTEFNVIPTFIKIDVQGHERFVLEGAKKILSKIRPIILMEFDLSKDKDNALKCWSTMKANGYFAFEILEHGVINLVTEIPQSVNYYDLLFLPSLESSFQLQL